MYRRNRRECPNPLFLKWLEEWRVEASEKNSKLQYAYAKAIASLKKYPLPLQNGQEAMILDNIGGMIARRLDEALAKYNSSNQPEAVESIKIPDEISEEEADRITESLQVPPPGTCNTNSDVTEGTVSRKRSHPKQKASREYIPPYRSGPYALILILYQQSQLTNYRGYMTKSELQRDAQPLSDASFTVPDPGKYYTAWSSMSSLIKKGYVIKDGNPARYSITDSGCLLAQKLESVLPDSLMSPTNSSTTMPLASDSISLPLSCSSVQSTFNSSDVKVSTKKFHLDLDSYDNHCIEAERNEFTKIENKQQKESNLILQRLEGDSKIPENPEYVLRPGSFDIILCVDFVETTAGATKSRKDALITELKNNGVQFDVRKLQLGDFLWIARERTTPIPGCLQAPVACELVLDHIVERKRMDDLCGSIIDGRFKEQKFRLRHCGLKHPIYLVEDFGSSQHMSLPESTLQQAIVNTQVVDGFFVKRTHDFKESVAYLTLMTRYLQRMYKNKTLVSCRQGGLVQVPSDGSTSYLMTFKEFNDSTVKNKVMTVSEIFAKQLMQIRGVSADKAAAILEKYPTPKKLVDAYEAQTAEKEKELLLSALKAGRSQRNIGPSLSSLIYRFFHSTTLC